MAFPWSKRGASGDGVIVVQEAKVIYVRYVEVIFATQFQSFFIVIKILLIVLKIYSFEHIGEENGCVPAKRLWHSEIADCHEFKLLK